MSKPLSGFLVTIHTPDGGMTRVVNENTFTIGRATECAVSFSDLNVSRGHLFVKTMSGLVYVEDQNSANGTFLNGTRIEAKRLVPVRPEDMIKLGSAGPLISIQAVDGVSNEQAVEEGVLKKKDRHAGKESLVQRDVILEEAHKAARVIMDKAKAYHDQVVSAAISESMTAAKATVEKLITESKADAAQLLREAQATAVRTVDEAKFAANGILEGAKLEAEKYAREHKEGSEKDADAYFSKRHQEIEQFSIRKAAEVDDYRAAQERQSRETMAKEIEVYIREKRELESATQKFQEELDHIAPQLKAMKAEFEALTASTAALRDENSKLNVEKAELIALESKREELGKQVANMERQLAEAEKSLPARLAEDQAAFEKESNRRRFALNEELTNQRLSEMERLRRERAEAIASIARERERLGKKILVDVQQAAVSFVPVEQWRAAAETVESAIHENLKLHSLTASAEDSLSPLISQVASSRKRQRAVWTLQGFFLGAVVLVAGWQGMHQVFNEEDPMKTAAKENARRIKEDLELRKFNPPQDDELRSSYVDSVIYTQGFVEKYRDAEFQKRWLKKASTYFLKKWKVQEESVVQVISATSTLVSTLAERKEAIHPDRVSDGLKKMNELEAETLLQIKNLLGSEVRVEAFKRLEKKTFTEFYSLRAPAQSDPTTHK